MPLHAQVSFGLKGGLNETKLSLNQSDLEESISNKSGFFIGPTVRFTLPIVSLGMDAAVLYDQREGEAKDTGEKLQQKSIQIPIHARYGIGLGTLASLYLFVVSVNYNFALSKNAEYKVIKNGIENHVKVKNNAWQIALAYYF